MAAFSPAVNQKNTVGNDFFGVAAFVPKAVSNAAIRRLSSRLVTPDGTIADLGDSPKADFLEDMLRGGARPEAVAEDMILSARIARSPVDVAARVHTKPLAFARPEAADRMRERSGLGPDQPVVLPPPRRDPENPDQRAYQPPPAKYPMPVVLHKNPQLVGDLLNDIQGRIWPSRHGNSGTVPVAVAEQFFRLEAQIEAHVRPLAPAPAPVAPAPAPAAFTRTPEHERRRDAEVAADMAERLAEAEREDPELAAILSAMRFGMTEAEIADQFCREDTKAAPAPSPSILPWIKDKMKDPRFKGVSPEFAAGVSSDIQARQEQDRDQGPEIWVRGEQVLLHSHLVDWSMEALAEKLGLTDDERHGNAAVGNAKERASILNGHTPREVRKRQTQDTNWERGAEVIRLHQADTKRTLSEAIRVAGLTPSTGYRAVEFYQSNERVEAVQADGQPAKYRYQPRPPHAEKPEEIAATAAAASAKVMAPVTTSEVSAMLSDEAQRAHRQARTPVDEVTQAAVSASETLRRLGLNPAPLSATLLMTANAFLGDDNRAPFRPSAWLDALLNAGANPGVRLGLEDLSEAAVVDAAEALSVARGVALTSAEHAVTVDRMASAQRSLERIQFCLRRPLKSRGNGLDAPRFRRRDGRSQPRQPEYQAWAA